MVERTTPTSVTYPQPSAKAARFHLSDGWFGFLITVPALLIMLTVFVFPLVFSAYTSLHRFEITRPDRTRFLGFENYVTVLQDEAFQRALGNTLTYVFVAVPVEFAIGLGLAMALATITRGRGMFRTLLVIPQMLAPAVMALMWKFMYNDELGIINHLLREFGINRPPLWLTETPLALFSIIIVEVWATVPIFVLLLLAGLLSIPSEYYEAAAIDGGSAWAVFRHITLPLLQPVILVALLIRGMDAFRVFDLVYVLTGGGPALRTDVLSFYIFRTAFTDRDFGLASAGAWIVSIILLTGGLILIRFMRRQT
ncbi:MAG: sugar ABC transporter permease [Chloroflexota bacterium]|nr:sugar ABC transporter permease [Chloroflexota bacterium]